MRWVICAGVLLALVPHAYAGDFDVLRGSGAGLSLGWFLRRRAGRIFKLGREFRAIRRARRGLHLAQHFDRKRSEHIELDGARLPLSGEQQSRRLHRLQCRMAEPRFSAVKSNYNHVFLSASSSGSLTRDFTDSGNLPAGHHYFYTLTVTGQAAMSMTDIATFRARAGWQAGQFPALRLRRSSRRQDVDIERRHGGVFGGRLSRFRDPAPHPAV